jgi:signal peptidase I
MVVNGESMLPLMREGDRLRIQSGNDLPRHGEIITFHCKNGLVALRLLRLSRSPQGESLCLAQGDPTSRLTHPSHLVRLSIMLSPCNAKIESCVLTFLPSRWL